MPDFIGAAIAGGMEPDLLAEKVVEGIQNNALYIVPQEDMKGLFDLRVDAIQKVYGA